MTGDYDGPDLGVSGDGDQDRSRALGENRLRFYRKFDFNKITGCNWFKERAPATGLGSSLAMLAAIRVLVPALRAIGIQIVADRVTPTIVSNMRVMTILFKKPSASAASSDRGQRRFFHTCLTTEDRPRERRARIDISAASY